MALGSTFSVGSGCWRWWCCESSVAHFRAMSALVGLSMHRTSVLWAKTLSRAASFRFSKLLAVTSQEKDRRMDPLTESPADLLIKGNQCLLPVERRHSKLYLNLKPAAHFGPVEVKLTAFDLQSSVHVHC